MTGVQTLVRGIQERFATECYDCGREIEITEGRLDGELYECPDCGLELELRIYDPNMRERHGPVHQVNYDGDLCQVTLAKSPEEKEDWGE